jgi:hypothetical protein
MSKGETAISIADAKTLVSTDDTAVFREVMDRTVALQQLFKGHTGKTCVDCAPHKHMPCFINYVHILSDKNPYRLLEIVDYFMEIKGGIKERYVEATEKYSKTSEAFRQIEAAEEMPMPPMPKAVEDLIRGIMGALPSGGRHKLAIMVSPTEIIVKGDDQPSDEQLDQVLSAHVPMYKPGKFKVTRVDENGKPFNTGPVFVSPMMKLVDIDSIEDKVKAQPLEETGTDFIARMMKGK